MNARIEFLPETKLIGKSLRMSLVNNKTGELWGSFMPRKREITNPVSNDLYSLQVYDPAHFENFNPAREFTKWALVQVQSFDAIPEGLDSFTIPAGLYAVFTHKGSSTDTSIFQ